MSGPNLEDAVKGQAQAYAKTNRKPLIIGAVIAAIVIGSLFGVAKCAHAATNLALTCWSNTASTSVPANCPQGWTWHTPGKGTIVTTQTGSWRVYQIPPSSDVIELCTADLSPGAVAAQCPKASIVYKPACNAVGQSCVGVLAPPITPAPRPTAAAPSAHLTWQAPTQNVDGSVLSDLSGYNIYRGAAADGSDLVAFTSITGVAVLDFTDSTSALAFGVQTCYALKSLNAKKIESEYSNVACVTPQPKLTDTWAQPVTNLVATQLN